jgi:hypothetical protein
MATTYKVLGQVYPSATTNTDLYTVGSGKSAVVSTINVCNNGTTTDAVRIAVRKAGASIENKQYIVYGDAIAPGSFMAITIGITLEATDVITVYSTTGTTAFNAFGSELS